MITEEEYTKVAGMMSAEFQLAVVPSAKHRTLFESYRLNLGHGERTVCKMILGDFWRFMDLGAKRQAADQFLVLRLFLSEHGSPECFG